MREAKHQELSRSHRNPAVPCKNVKTAEAGNQKGRDGKDFLKDKGSKEPMKRIHPISSKRAIKSRIEFMGNKFREIKVVRKKGKNEGESSMNLFWQSEKMSHKAIWWYLAAINFLLRRCFDMLVWLPIFYHLWRENLYKSSNKTQ